MQKFQGTAGEVQENGEKEGARIFGSLMENMADEAAQAAVTFADAVADEVRGESQESCFSHQFPLDSPRSKGGEPGIIFSHQFRLNLPTSEHIFASNPSQLTDQQA